MPRYAKRFFIEGFSMYSQDDLRFAKKTEEAWKRYEKGLFKKMDAEEFLKELKKW